jgi:hypothetical protein
MNIESITFDSFNNEIVVMDENGINKKYKNSNEYLFDFPKRESDCIAMNWPSDFPNKHDKQEDREKNK